MLSSQLWSSQNVANFRDSKKRTFFFGMILTFKTAALCTTSRGTWGRVSCRFEDGSTKDVVGTFPCDPTNIVIGSRFTAELKSTTFRRKPNFTIEGEVTPLDADKFAITNRLAEEISHVVLQQLLKHIPNLYEYCDRKCKQCCPLTFDCLNESESSLVAKTFQSRHGAIVLQRHFPFMSTKDCIELSEAISHSATTIEAEPYLITQSRASKKHLSFADRIAKQNGMDPKARERLDAYTKYILMTLHNREKHFWFTETEIMQELLAAMSKNEWPIHLQESECIESIKHVTTFEKDLYSLKEHAQMEKDLASQLRKIFSKDKTKLEYIGVSDDLDLQQRAAVEASLTGSIILTGKAGTGKTKTIAEIARVLQQLSVDVRLCAPTGKAAVRMTESVGKKVGIKATTVHYLTMATLEDVGEKGVVLIIDESSMMAPWLLLKLLHKVHVRRLILVGDDNQLPSIDPGCLLQDLIKSGIFEVCELTQIHRQGDGSILAQKSHDILRGDAWRWAPETSEVFSLTFSHQGLDDAIEKTKQLHNTSHKVQMLVLTRRSAGQGNELLQDTFNSDVDPESLERFKKAPWKRNDRIIAMENFYEDGELRICNGSHGKIIKANKKKNQVETLIDGVVRVYDAATSAIEHSYALTLHKFQGSEVDCVVIYLDYIPNMVSKQAIYTAVTRGKKKVFIFCSESIWKLGCQKDGNERRTRLADRCIEQVCKRLRSD